MDSEVLDDDASVVDSIADTALDEEDDIIPKITVGICAMDKKVPVAAASPRCGLR